MKLGMSQFSDRLTKEWMMVSFISRVDEIDVRCTPEEPE